MKHPNLHAIHRARLVPFALAFASAALLVVACDDGGTDPDMMSDTDEDTGATDRDTSVETDATETAPDVTTAETTDPTDVDAIDPDLDATTTPDTDATDATDAADATDATDGGDTDMVVDLCGNGALDAGEDCDGSELNSQTCELQGFAGGGALACTVECTFDTDACIATACGNGAIETGENCDGTDLGGATCESLGLDPGLLTCDPVACDYDTTLCAVVCGNELIDGADVCDGTDLAGESCEGLGYASGTLACASDCSGYDETACIAAVCGNAMTETGEACDGADLAGETCGTLGAGQGTLACATDCLGFDTSGCTPLPSCGNDTREIGELCDGTDLNGQSCVGRGFMSGTLACQPNCVLFDTSACVPFPVCNNNSIESGELCDGNDLGGQTCADEGFFDGALDCANDCAAYDTSGCRPFAVCGDGVAETDQAELCDGADLAGATCVTEGFFGGSLGCNGSCDGYVTTGCIDPPVCNNGNLDPGEFCDGALLGGKTCFDVGFIGGTLACATDCSGFDTAGCAACAADPREDDDTRSAATELAGPVSFADGTLCAGDPDWFTIELAEGDLITFDIGFTTANGDLELLGFGPTGALFATSTSSSDDESITYSVPLGGAGEYAFQVLGVGSDVNTYTVDVAVAPYVLTCPADDLHEDNDDQPRAEPIAVNDAYNAIACAGDLDWYAIDLVAGQAVTIDLDFVHADGNLDLYLYRPGFPAVATSLSTTDGERIAYQVPAGEADLYGILVAGSNTSPYVVSVSECGDGSVAPVEACDGTALGGESCLTQGFPNGGGSISCNATCDGFDTTSCTAALQCPENDVFEPNGSPTAGELLTAGASVDAIVCASDIDWFRVDAPVGATITIDLAFVHADGNLSLSLHQANGAAITNSQTTDDNEQIVHVVTATDTGPFGIRVYPGTAGATNTYQLGVNVATP